MTRERGLLEDKRAERDGDWIISDKYDMIVPYQDPISRYELVEEGKPPVQRGKVIVITQNASSEWDTKFWGRGGHLDQVYMRAKAGQAPNNFAAHTEDGRSRESSGSLML